MQDGDSVIAIIRLLVCICIMHRESCIIIVTIDGGFYGEEQGICKAFAGNGGV